MKKRTLRQIVNEQLTMDPKQAATLEPIIKKYADRAVQDKLPEAQLLAQLAQEITAAKNPQPQQQQQPQQQPVQQQGVVQK